MVPAGSTQSRPATRIGPARAGAAAFAIAIVMSACGLSGAPSPSGVPASSPTAAVPATPTPTTEPTPTATLAPTATPTVAPSVAPAFACIKLPYKRSSAAYAIKVADIRLGTHPGYDRYLHESGYDRIVWEFAGRQFPDIRIENVTPPFRLDPSDLPVTIDGKAFIQIKIQGVLVETIPESADDPKPGYPMLVELRQTTGYEGDGTWIAGLSGPACVRVSIFQGPSRLVVDVAPAY